MIKESISAKQSYPSKYVDVYGSKMHYVEAGAGDPILLLHGIPTSNYLWRNIIPHLAPLGHCIAPDLIGLGQSDKPNIDYTLFDHIRYIDKFIETLGLENIILIMHGWGSVIGFNYAMGHQANCKGLAFYEAFLRSLEIEEEAALPFQEQLFEIHEEQSTNNLAMNGIAFVDKIIPQSVMRKLTDEEMNNYRQPFIKQGSEKPIIQYLKDLPTDNGQTTKIDQLIMDYTQKLTKSKLPKLMLYSLPGFITTIATVMWAKENLPKLEIVDIGEELHLGQESNPTLMGEAISVWIQTIEQNG